MPLIFKLVGFTHNNKFYEIVNQYEGQLKYELLQQTFYHLGLTTDEINNIKFIIDSEQIKDPHKVYNIVATETKTIFVFTTNNEIKRKLQEIFIKIGQLIEKHNSSTSSTDSASASSTDSASSDTDILQPLVNEDKPKLELTDEIIENMNQKTVALFSDSDFRSLISIYLRKPELFNTLSQYVQSGNIVEKSLTIEKEYKDLNEGEIIKYNELLQKIKQLNLDVSDDIIMNKLIKYSGHLNLTLRAILHDYSLL